MLTAVRRSLALKLFLVSALPSAAFLVAGLLGLIEHTRHLAPTHPALAFAQLRTGVMAGAALALAFAGAAIWLTLRKLLVRPVRQLLRAMKRAEEGEILVRAPVESTDELGTLSTSFNTMLARVTDLAVHQIESRYQLERVERELSHQKELRAADEALAARVRELELLAEVSIALAGTLDLPEQLEQLGRRMCARLSIAEFSVLLLDDAAQRLVVEAVAGDAPHQARGTPFALGEGITGRAVEGGETLYVHDVRADARYLHFKHEHRTVGSFLAIPLRAHGAVLGALCLNRPTVDAFSPQEIRLCEAVAAQAALAIRNARLFAQTLELSITDPLTGLANRRHLMQRLEQELSRRQRFGDELSVLLIDVDHFKRINDERGHAAGDAVLRGLAEVLRRSVRRVDLVARLGGEEFCVVLPRVSALEALEVAEKLRRQVQLTAFLPGAEAPAAVTISIGVAAAVGAGDAAQLLARADERLYEAKRSGRNAVSVERPLLHGTEQQQPH